MDFITSLGLVSKAVLPTTNVPNEKIMELYHVYTILFLMNTHKKETKKKNNRQKKPKPKNKRKEKTKQNKQTNKNKQTNRTKTKQRQTNKQNKTNKQTNKHNKKYKQLQESRNKSKNDGLDEVKQTYIFCAFRLVLFEGGALIYAFVI